MQPTSLFLAAVFALSATDDEWARVLPGLELVYPRDHGAHLDHRIEWWYLTGQATNDEGRRFGYQFTIFRRGMVVGAPPKDESPLRARQVYAGHLAITDVEDQRTWFAERLRRSGVPLARASDEDLDLVLEDWSLARGDGNRLELLASDPASGIALELELNPRKPLVLHGNNGYSSKGNDPGNASAYMSWTRMRSTGRLTVDGAVHSLTGEAWFDHEFGTSVLDEGVVGWDWFGLHLDDGRELMLFGLRREDGSPSASSAATLVDKDGNTRTFGTDDFEIEVLEHWTSPRGGARYPAGWKLRIPAAALELEVGPLVPDCELGTDESTGVAYWEGPVDVGGTVSGRGYAELTGYAGSMAGRF